jgi:hypothetical protein
LAFTSPSPFTSGTSKSTTTSTITGRAR